MIARCEDPTPGDARGVIALGKHRSTGLQEIGPRKLIAGSLGFLLPTLGMFWYLFHRIHSGDYAPRWDHLQWNYCLLILLSLPVETLASGVRPWLLCRVLEPRIRLWTCFKAEWANVAIAMLTPSQSGGGPGQIYLLSREGTKVGTALTVSLLSFVGTMVGLLCMGVYSVLVSGVSQTRLLFGAAVWAMMGIGALSLRRNTRVGSLASRLDRLSAKGIEIVYTYRDDVRRFLRQGKTTFALVCLLSLIFLFSRALLPYLCLRFLGIESSSFRHIIEVQIALIFLVFFAPTPGGAGFAEAASFSLMDEIVPIGLSPYYTLLWRFLTLYLAAIAGFFCLLRALAQDARQIIRQPR
jgi:uncharacterized protein (TIRG00374 family)